jgi:hypothetical protein
MMMAIFKDQNIIRALKNIKQLSRAGGKLTI